MRQAEATSRVVAALGSSGWSSEADILAAVGSEDREAVIAVRGLAAAGYGRKRIVDGRVEYDLNDRGREWARAMGSHDEE